MFILSALVLSLPCLSLARPANHNLFARNHKHHQPACHHSNHSSTTSSSHPNSTQPSSNPPAGNNPPAANGTSNGFTLTDMYQGANFLEGWDFFSGSDPTHGLVQFLDQKSATSAGLAYVQSDGTTVLAVDNTTHVPVGGNRNSVRISTKKTYNGGLFITDVFAMPTGCSVWPAWWSVGPNWPQGGEIDIIEGVNTGTQNQYTLHTAEGCNLDSSVSKDLHTATIVGTQCTSSGSNNNGCAFVDTDSRSFGQSFNNIGGGVYAHLWDSKGIKAWHFARNEIPDDINARNPNPSSWGSPAAFWSATSCDIGKHFFDHVLTFDTTLCGDWAGSVYSSFGCPGTCAEAVADPSNFSNAKWKINYVAVYN
jgi:hypothetical protein